MAYKTLIGCLLVLAFVACRKTPLEEIEFSETPIVHVNTHNLSDNSAPMESRVDRLRLIIFDENSGLQLYNNIISGAPLAPLQNEGGSFIFEIPIPKGTSIRMALIANEQTTWDLSQDDRTISSIKSQLVDFGFSGGNLEIKAPFPMFAESEIIQVDGNLNVDMPLRRIVCKLSFDFVCRYKDFLESSSNSLLTLMSATVHRVNYRSTLSEPYILDGTQSVDLPIYRFASSDFLTNSEGFETAPGKAIKFYVPDSDLLPEAKNAYCYILIKAAYYRNGPVASPEEVTYTIPIGKRVDKLYGSSKIPLEQLTHEDLSLERNYHYAFHVTIHELGKLNGGDVNLVTKPWIPQEVDGDVSAPFLHISSNAISMTSLSKIRIKFWSNQPSDKIFIEPMGYSDYAGTQKVRIDTFYTGLRHEAGSNNTPNLVFLSHGQAIGYMDLEVDLSHLPPSNVESAYRSLVINANGLKKLIRINIQNVRNLQSNQASYIGTFHRWNQVGERIILEDNKGVWGARVVEGSDFILLDDSRSLDPDLFREQPGNPERYPVTDGRSSVSGNGKVYFRVGMKSKLSSSSQVRYGVIEVTRQSVPSLGGASNKHYIYVRQGEAADYVMRPNDPTGSGHNRRPLARRFCVYNLYDPWGLGGENLDDHSILTPRGAVFTEYPTIAGAFFLGYNRRAFHPFSPSEYQRINYWGYQNFSPTLWNIHTDEVAPRGYRRPYSFTSQNSSSNKDFQSEYVESLFLTFSKETTQQNSSEGMPKNFIYGFYADGFFDRRTMTETNGVCYVQDNYNRAYHGFLVFNPSTNASLFFPLQGMRNSRSGALQHAIDKDGIQCRYATATPKNNHLRHRLLFDLSPNFSLRMTLEYSNDFKAACVRCVEED